MMLNTTRSQLIRAAKRMLNIVLLQMRVEVDYGFPYDKERAKRLKALRDNEDELLQWAYGDLMI